MNPKAGGKGANTAGVEEAKGDLRETQGIRWIRYAPNDGQIHREKVESKQAIKLAAKKLGLSPTHKRKDYLRDPAHRKKNPKA